jgi:hypothetical protein
MASFRTIRTFLTATTTRVFLTHAEGERDFRRTGQIGENCSLPGFPNARVGDDSWQGMEALPRVA